MIQGLVTNNPIPSIGYVLNASVGGKVALPVEPVYLVYSHLKHVSGVPAPEGSSGVAISKLNILDVLIEQMSQIRKTGNSAVSTQVSEDRLDAMIEAYNAQIRQAWEARTAMPYTATPPAQAGTIFNFQA